VVVGDLTLSRTQAYEIFLSKFASLNLTQTIYVWTTQPLEMVSVLHLENLCAQHKCWPHHPSTDPQHRVSQSDLGRKLFLQSVEMTLRKMNVRVSKYVASHPFEI
jgi:hypothetical protein